MTQNQQRPGVAIDASIPIVRFSEIESTSGFARAEIAAGRLTAPTVVVATRQTGGLGRFKRPWASPDGGLWMSLAWPCLESELQERLDGLGLRVGVACLRAVRRIIGASERVPPVRLKWPNDVVIAGKKVLGVLTEVVHAPAGARTAWIIVGVGVNANFDTRDLPEALRDHSTTLQAELGHRIDAIALETDLLAELHGALVARGVSRELLVEAIAALHGLDRDTTVTLPDGTRVSGVLKGLNEHGIAVLDIDGRVFVPPLGSVIMQANG